MRKTMRETARLLEVARVATPGLVPTLTLHAHDGDKSLKFAATVGIGATNYEVAADNGKLKTFATADDFVKTIAKYMPTGSGTYALSVATGLVLVGSIPSDLKKDAASKVLKYGAVKTSQQAQVVSIDADLALMVDWENGNALQQARKAEVQAQRVAVVEDIAAIDALIANYTAIANS